MKSRHSCFVLLGATLLLPLAGGLVAIGQEPGAPLPDVSRWTRPAAEDDAFFAGRAVCGAEALNFWMRSCAWRRDPAGAGGKESQFERLLNGNSEQTAQVNKEIARECERVLADAPAWREAHPHSRNPAFWILLALRTPDQLTADTHRLIREALAALDVGGKEAGYIGWTHVNGANGANVHGYLTPLTLAPAVIDDPQALAAGKQALRAELAHMNRTGDMGEFNLLESHWNGTASWEMIKRHIPDPRLRRMARMIAERLWINRFLTWSPAVERITGPGSRMAPSEWLGCDNERALLATGMTRPVWINFFFPWDGWDSRAYRNNWPLAQTEAAVPVLPAYLQDLAWDKTLPGELQCLVDLKHWRPCRELPGAPETDPMRPMKYVNYQGHGYALGSTTSSWVVNTCVVGASAWWNNSRNPDAALGSPERFCALYPHYVINGMSFLDRGEIHFENAGGKPVADSKGGEGGPYLREFIDFGRVGTLQDRNTLLLSYTPKPGTHHAGQNFVKNRVQRASAAMFLFRWTGGTDGLYVNRQPVRDLPRELNPGDWWFIEDGDVYAAVRPLTATRLRGGRTLLERRTRHIVLYQDNIAATGIEGIGDEEWVKARSGFVVEMGDKSEHGSFASFQDRILTGKVTADEADGFVRHIAYERDDRRLEMKWNCYTEEYPVRRINGRDDPWPRYAQSPEFAVSDAGRLTVKDATLESEPGKTCWLLACEPSRTWVAYQPNPGETLSLTLDCPAGRLSCGQFGFGKVAVTQSGDEVIVDADTEAATLQIETTARAVRARIGGDEVETTRGEGTMWNVSAE